MSKRTNRILVAALLLSTVPLGGALSGPELWISDPSGTLGKVDVQTGTVTIVGNMGQMMLDLAFDPSGQLYGITFSGLYKINSTTAATTLVGPQTTGTNSLIFAPNGWAYAAQSQLYEINSFNGASIAIGNGGTSYSSGGDLAFAGGRLYLATGSNQLVILNTANGAGTTVGSIGYPSVWGLASPDNTTLYGVSGTKIITINTTTGVGTLVLDYAGHGLGIANGTAFFGEAGNKPCGPDIEVQKTRDANIFMLGTRNTGAPIIGPAKIELVDLLPSGLTVLSYNLGTGWTCTPAAPVIGPDSITCTYSILTGTTIATGQSLPSVNLVTSGTGDCPNCIRGRLYQWTNIEPVPTMPPPPPGTVGWQLVTETNTVNNAACVH